ncbi:MAG: hypothetical protein J6129_02005, partial [Bacteroidaceae bacterium]|nr:hypothetical protein [Bacteroidaceae bacterium]
MDLSFLLKITPFFISCVLGLLIIPNLRLLASKKKNFLPENADNPKNGMMVGGIAFFPIILIALCTSVSLPYLLQIAELRVRVEPAAMRIMQLIVGCSILFITGLKDDLHGTGGFVKVGTLFIAA